MAADPRELAGSLLWVGFEGVELDRDTREHLAALRPAGVVLFRRNIRSLDQVSALCAELRALLGADLFIAVDQEGGLVERFSGLLPSFPGNMALGAIGMREPGLAEHLAEEQGRLLGGMLSALGIDVVLAPDLDLAVTGANPSTGIRSFGAHPGLAARLGAALIRGFTRGGVLCCAKHFPGLGAAQVDSHLDLPVVTADDREAALQPFAAAVRAGVPLVMTSHVIYSALDADHPATLSAQVVTHCLRERLGFTGFALTDDLEMGAMSRRFAFEGVVRGAVAAGHDGLALCASRALQQQAHALLTAGLSQDAPWCRGVRTSAQRLAALRGAMAPARHPAPPASALVREATALGTAIAGRAITVVSDEQGLLPLNGETLLVLPVLAAGTPVEDPLRGESDASALVEALPCGTAVLRTEARPDAAAIAQAVAQAAQHRTVILALTGAAGLQQQAQLAREIARTHPRVIAVALRSPFDLEWVPASCTRVAACGFRAEQLAALGRVLSGATQGFAYLPVTLESRES